MISVLFALFGVIFGSFANVVILRDDRRASILTGRSECMHCHHELQWYELIPVLSYVSQGGKCRACHKHISLQYPLVELAMGGLFYFASTLSVTVFPAALLAISFFFFFCACIIDLRTQLIPVEYVLVAGVVGGLAQILLKTDLQSLVIGIVAGAGILAVIKYGWRLLMHQDGMGEGDIWLGGALGALCPYPIILVALVSAIFAGAVLGIVITSVKKGNWERAIPFGPFLFFGALVALVWGNQLVTWYTGMSGITF